MRWVQEVSEFESIFRTARDCACMDSGRIPSTLAKFILDHVEICTQGFAGLLQRLMHWSADMRANYIVLSPDPISYFHRHFHKYPLLEFTPGEQTDAYLSSLQEDPGGSPADAVGINWWEIVIVPPSSKWFVHGLHVDDGVHLWVPQSYSLEIAKTYPWAHRSAQDNLGVGASST
jgi:hypothetical protein